MTKEMKHTIKLFLVGWPYGLLGKAYEVENNKVGKYTLWDRIRYRLLVGERLEVGE